MASSQKGSSRAATPSPSSLHTSSGYRSSSPVQFTSSHFGTEGFGSLFCHNLLKDKKDFEAKALMGKEIPEKPLHVDLLHLDLDAACDLQTALENWLDSLENVSTSDLRKNSGESVSDVSDTSEKVTEVTLKSLFTNYANFLKKSDDCDMPMKWNAYPDDPRGCLVTVASKHNIACLNKKTQILFQGVCKNRDKYETMDGIRQCAAYLYHQLWWFRTVQGVDVEQVYGLVVCGPKCKGVAKNKVVVSLLVLSAPEQKIGAPLKLWEYREEFETVNTSLFHTLGNFVQEDWRSGVNMTKFPDVRCYPGCMMIPSSLLLEKCSVWDVVQSGTAALVIRLTLQHKEKALEFVGKFYTTDIGMRQLTKFVTSQSDSGKETIYLKMKTYASGEHWVKSGLVLVMAVSTFDSLLEDNQKAKMQTWRSIYPSHQPVLTSDNNVIVLMNDMGCQLSQLKKPDSYPKFCCEYLSMMEETLNVQDMLQLIHGDIHQGNLLYKEAAPENHGKLCLIDWDEASWSKPMKRTVITKVQKERYPEKLLENPQAYTKAQLFLLFRDISESLYEMNVCIVQGNMQSIEERVDEKLSVTEETVEERYGLLEAFLKKKKSDM